MFSEFTKSLLLSRHKPLHRQGRGGGSLTGNHRLQQRCATDGSPNRAVHDVKLSTCRRMGSQDSPSGNNETPPSDNSRQKLYYEPPRVIPQ